MARISSQRKVLEKYPEAEVLHQRYLGRTVYAVVPERYSRRSLGDGFTASKAWVQAAKNIEAGKEPEVL